MSIRRYKDGVMAPKKVDVVFTKPSRTKQSMQAECDINLIMAKYQKTGLVSHVRRYEGRYEDVSQGLDYHEAMNVVIRANDAFMSLPAAMRARFQNDAGRWLEFVTNPKNGEELVKMGLAKARPVQAKPVETQAKPGSDKGPSTSEAKTS